MRKCSYHLLLGVIKLSDLWKSRTVSSPFDRQAACPRSQSQGTTEEIQDLGFELLPKTRPCSQHNTAQGTTKQPRPHRGGQSINLSIKYFSLLFPFLILSQVDSFIKISSPNLEYSMLDKLTYLQPHSSATPLPIFQSLPRGVPIQNKPTFFCPPQ